MKESEENGLIEVALKAPSSSELILLDFLSGFSGLAT